MDYLSEHPNEPFRFAGFEQAEQLLSWLGVERPLSLPLMFNDHFTHWIFATYMEQTGYKIVCLPKSRLIYEQAMQLFHNFKKDPEAMTIQEFFIAHWRSN